MTRRRASPGPSGRLQVAMAFSQMSSSGCRGQIERGHSKQHKLRFWVFVFIPYRTRNLDATVQQTILIQWLSPTHPLRGCHTGSLLHMSLKILKMMTQDLRSVTLASRDKKTKQSDGMKRI